MTMPYSASFGSKERLQEYMSDFFAEVPEGYDPEVVADVIIEELDSWIAYHQRNIDTYEAVRTALGKRVSKA
jgi:hypothetical protein